jgi:hypothetical protein
MTERGLMAPILSLSEMHGADKFQNGPGRFAVESTRDGKEILLKHRLRTKSNHK